MAGFQPSTCGTPLLEQLPARDRPSSSGPLDPRWVGVGDASSGLCGGMSWYVREHVRAKKRAIPPDTTPPANGSPLFQAIVRRQVESLDWLKRAAAVLLAVGVGVGRQARAPGGRPRLVQDHGLPSTAASCAIIGLIRQSSWNPFGADLRTTRSSPTATTDDGTTRNLTHLRPEPSQRRRRRDSRSRPRACRSRPARRCWTCSTRGSVEETQRLRALEDQRVGDTEPGPRLARRPDLSAGRRALRFSMPNRRPALGASIISVSSAAIGRARVATSHDHRGYKSLVEEAMNCRRERQAIADRSGPWSPTGRMCAASRSLVARPSGNDPTVKPVTAHLNSYSCHDLAPEPSVACDGLYNATRSLGHHATSSPATRLDDIVTRGHPVDPHDRTPRSVGPRPLQPSDGRPRRQRRSGLPSACSRSQRSSGSPR